MRRVSRARASWRYHAVIQLRPPPLEHGYQRSDLRPESAEEAALIDARIHEAWAGHPRHFIVESDANFLRKLHRAAEVFAEVGARELLPLVSGG